MINPTIGFIGLGIMGRPMATNLLKAGFALVVFDINSAAVKDLVEIGAQTASSPQEIAEKCKIVITMLPDSPDVELVCLGEQGLIKGLKEDSLFIDMSTISPKVSIRLAQILEEKKVSCLDAPVSGGEVGAINAALSIMVGGDAQVLEQVRPIFEVLGKTITLCGGHGAGQVVKACNQVQVALNILGMSEALLLGKMAGVDPQIVHQVLSKGYAQSRVSDVRGPKVVQGDFQPGFKSKFHYKDLKIILETGKEYHAPLPVTSLVHDLFATLIDCGRGDLDHSGIITLLEDMALDIKTSRLPEKEAP